jgi:tetratricopeptide (TPR) repeat protein
LSERAEEPEEDIEETLDQASPAAVSLALGRTGKGDAGFDREAKAFLRKHSRLIDIQTEHLHEQRVLMLSHLRWRRFSDRMKALLQVMTAAVGLAVAVGVGGMALSASNERGLVIEPFSVPPDLAQKGLTGQVLASMVLDRLGEMQKDTVSVRAPSTYANDWNGDIKVEIPETGVSVGELYRLFVRWLGRQTSISGELYRTPTGLALSARTGTAPAKIHTGGEDDIDAMVQAAAEDVYATTQPYRYAIYLQRGKDPSSVERGRQALARLAQTGEKTDRIWAYAGLSLALSGQGDFDGAIRAGSAAISLEPLFNLGYANRGGAEWVIGRDEAALADAARAAATARSDGARFMRASALTFVTLQWQATIDGLHGDFQAAARNYSASVASDDQRDASDFVQIAEYQAQDHDLADALATGAEVASPASSDQSVSAAELRWRIAELGMRLAEEREDWAGVRAAVIGIGTRGLMPGDLKPIQTFDTPYLALAMARLGDFAGAEATISATPLDCYLCVRMRGRIAAAHGAWAAADRWFAEAVRQAPTPPFAYTEWGGALLDKGDVDGAIAKLTLAHAKGPHYADALELWGEALMRKGDFPGAADKFAAADKEAPRWGHNHLRWGVALLRLAQPGRARAQFEAANRLELSKPDRAGLDVLLRLTATGVLHG